MSVSSRRSRASRALNEKGKLFRLGTLQKERNKLSSQIYKELKVLDVLIKSNDVSEATEKATHVQVLFEQYMTLHGQCQLLISDPEDRSHEDEVADKVDRDVYRILKYLEDVTDNVDNVEEIENKARSLISIKSKESKRSSKSRSSSASSRMVKEKARLAELKIEEEYLKRENQRDELLLKLQVEKGRSNLQKEIEKSKARMKVFEEEIEEELDPFENKKDELKGIPVYDTFTEDYVSKLPPVPKLPPVHEQRAKPEDGGFHQVFKENEADKEFFKLVQPFKSTPLTMQKEKLEDDDDFYQLFKDSLAAKERLSKPFAFSHQPSKPETLPAKEVRFQDHGERYQPMTKTSDDSELTKLLKLTQAPKVELDTFSGNFIEYPYFIALFTQAVEGKVLDERGKLCILIKYTKGEPQELVKSCVLLSDDECYVKAKELLNRKYGSPYKIASEYRKQLTSWPKLKANDTTSFNKFETFLLKYKASMKSIGRSSTECNPELLQQLQSKLPSYLQDRWNRSAFQIRSREAREMNFNDFIKFVSEEAAIMSDPLFSREAIGELVRQPEGRTTSTKLKSFGTTLGEKKCIKCHRFHSLEDCKQLSEASPEAKKKFVLEQRLCFSCLKPISRTHLSKNCTNKLSCKKCNKSHPTSLHDISLPKPPVEPKPLVGPQPPVLPPDSSVKTLASNLTQSISLSIVAVNIRHSSNPQKYVTTLAMLDNGSQGTFVSQDVLKQLEVTGINTSLEIHTVTGKHQEKTSMVYGLEVSPVNEASQLSSISLPKVYSRQSLPVSVEEVPTPEKLKKWSYLDEISSHLPSASNRDIGLLIGSNCPRALEPLEIIESQNDGPFAYRSRLGWCVNGPMDISTTNVICSNRIRLKETINGEASKHYFSVRETIKDLTLKDMIIASNSLDFYESKQQDVVSVEDRRFLQLMESSQHQNGHYYLPLPLRYPDKIVPNNRFQVLQRTLGLKKRLLKDDKMLQHYNTFMNTLFENGYAKPSDKPPLQDKTWYIPHHGVYNPHKPDKIRVVFDCSIKFNNYCLNQELLQGPDLTNQLVGVLLRFREEPVAVIADIESMFYRVRVPDQFQSYLRFLWWPNGDLSQDPIDHQMTVHLFGGSSSPSCANYALRKTADDFQDILGEVAATILYRNFYVDDLLKSFESTMIATKVFPTVVQMCAKGAFRLTKVHSNCREFLATIPDGERSKSLKDLDLTCSPIPVERALGMSWCPEADVFTFNISLKESPMTRRGILSSISSIYDPLGLASPYLLEGKKLLQQICSQKCGWDEPLSTEQVTKWERWKSELSMLETLRIDRCLRPKSFRDVKEITLHHFSDASADAYGQVSYARYVSSDDQVSCRMVMSKSRVAPLKRPTIPRLELTAAVVSVKVAKSLRKELDVPIAEEFFWTDSQVVLSYISNETKRFHMFVSNRVQFIREETESCQWNYVTSKLNPADDASRGLSLASTAKNERWIEGPEFLKKDKSDWPTQPTTLCVSSEDKEVKQVKVNHVKIEEPYNILAKLEEMTTNWTRMKRIVARMLVWRKKVKSIDVEVLEKAEKAIIQLVQKKAFPEEYKLLTKQHQLKRSSNIIKLSPFIGEDGLIRVGGRIKMADIPFEQKHPIILPRKSKTTNAIVHHAHQLMQHAGRNTTLHRLREDGFWVINGNSFVRHTISKCVRCRILRGKTEVQRMADLPQDRTQEAPPFTYVGVDLFGPFVIKERRSELKRYGIIFTCLNSRSVHLESVTTMETDSFIMSLRRLIARRGPVRLVRCDNGTNFVGARNELQKCLLEMNDQQIKDFLLKENSDFISWKHNTPHASNFGGVWERLIRSTRVILESLLQTHGSSLNDESFRTLLVEVEGIINSRPLTVDCLADNESPLPISPINLLTMKSRVIMPPPGNFQSADVYCRKRWRRVQHIANEFWVRWRKDFLATMQTRNKWVTKNRNLKVGDVVLCKDDNVQRNQWKLALVTSVRQDQNDNVVRSVMVKQGSSTYWRPVNKLVLILENQVDDGN